MRRLTRSKAFRQASTCDLLCEESRRRLCHRDAEYKYLGFDPCELGWEREETDTNGEERALTGLLFRCSVGCPRLQGEVTQNERRAMTRPSSFAALQLVSVALSVSVRFLLFKH